MRRWGQALSLMLVFLLASCLGIEAKGGHGGSSGSGSDSSKTVYVRGYTRNDGTVVQPYYRAPPGQGSAAGAGPSGAASAYTPSTPVLPTSLPAAQYPSSVLAVISDFQGDVTAILDHQTLEVTPQFGPPLRVRLNPSLSWPVSRAALTTAALHRHVTISTATALPDGSLHAFVLLPNDLPLIYVLEHATWDTPAAKHYLQQEAVQRREAAETPAPPTTLPETPRREADERRQAQVEEAAERKRVQERQAKETVQEAQRLKEQAIHDQVATILRQERPVGYQDKIDAHFAGLLKDPDSRRITYPTTTSGGLVCGAVNARNAFGGYTGRQPFVATFTDGGQLQALKVYNDDKLLLMQYDTGLEGQLFRQCGFGT